MFNSKSYARYKWSTKDVWPTYTMILPTIHDSGGAQGLPNDVFITIIVWLNSGPNHEMPYDNKVAVLSCSDHFGADKHCMVNQRENL